MVPTPKIPQVPLLGTLTLALNLMQCNAMK